MCAVERRGQVKREELAAQKVNAFSAKAGVGGSVSSHLAASVGRCRVSLAAPSADISMGKLFKQYMRRFCQTRFTSANFAFVVL